MRELLLVAILINTIPKSHTKKLPYKIMYSRKLKLPKDVALQPLQSTCMPAVGDYV